MSGIKRTVPAWSKLASGVSILAVAVVAGVISFGHIDRLTVALHQSAAMGHLMPFGIDGLIVVGSVVLLQAEPGQRWLGWVAVGPGVAVSIFANLESGLRYGWLAATWAAIPALSFALSCFVLENWVKAQAKCRASAQAPESVPDAPASATVTAPVMVAPVAPETAPRASHGTLRTRQRATPGDDIERRAKRVLARQPDISGADLGRVLGASPRTGQRLLARLNDAA